MRGGGIFYDQMNREAVLYSKGMQVDLKEAAIREAILDMVAYFAVFHMSVTEERLVNLLSVRTSHLAVRASIRQLMTEKRLKKLEDGSYAWPGRRYDNLKAKSLKRAQLLKKARSYGRWMGHLSFIKAVVVVNSVAVGNVTPESDIDLLVVTTPGRVFVAKGILWRALKILGQLETAEVSAGQFSLGMFLTTRGVKVERDLMKVNDPHLVYWLMTGEPVYGARRWYELLQGSSYIRDRMPNYIWPKGGASIDRAGWGWLDSWDNRGYRIHLKHTSQQKKNLLPAAFVRIRPDIINLHALDKSANIAEQWQKIRGIWIEPSHAPTQIKRPRKPKPKQSTRALDK